MELNTEEKQVFDVPKVNIFKAGRWNGDKYSVDDLDEIVKSFDEIGATVKPYLKLGHNEGQELLQKDGLPAAGWIKRVYRIGEDLFADFINVPKKIKELIETRAYGRFSSEIFWNLKESGKSYPRVLKAVALLGADTPAIGSLDDFINLYTGENYEKIITCEIYQEAENMEDLKKYELENEELKAKLAEYAKKVDALDKLAAENAELKEHARKEKAQRWEADVDSFIGEQVKAGKILPAQTGILKALCEDMETVKTYTVENGAEKKGTSLELVKEFVSSMPVAVQLGEKSENVEIDKTKNYTDKNEDEILHERITKYAKENKVDYRTAWNAIAIEGGK